MKRLIPAIVVAVAALVAAPAPAWAYGEPTGPTRVATGGTANYAFENIPIDVTTLDVSVEGPAAATLSALVSRTYPVTSGIVSVVITFPVTGDYTITGTGSGASSGSFAHTISVAAVVAPADTGLPATGSDPTPLVWFGAGAVLLGVVIIVVLIITRRRSERPSSG